MSTDADESGSQTADSTPVTSEIEGCLYFRDHPSDKYTIVTSRTSDGDDTSVHLHQILACVEHDPNDVFAEGNVVHHEAQTSVPIDVASNLRVMDAGDHARGHADGTLEPTPIAEVLDEG